MAKIRGLKKPEDIRLVILINHPEDLNKVELEAELGKVGSMQTNLADDKFAKNTPLFGGKCNGWKKALILINKEKDVPDNITVKGHKIDLI